MSKEGLIFLIVFSLVIVLAVFLIVFFSVRNSKYKSFILTNSKAIHDLDSLNKEYVFIRYNDNKEVYYRFDNKSTWNKTETVAYLTREIKYNLDYWCRIRDAIKSNREKLKEYEKDYKKIYVPISEEVCVENKKRFKKCLKMEKNIFDSKIQKPHTNLTVKVKLRYVSKKGQVDVNKTGVFGFIEVVRIIDSVSTAYMDKVTRQRLIAGERAVITDSIRYDVMKRDGFRCVLCGMSAKDGAILHVDHIIPVSKGGKSTMSNLRTLCEKCNMGKSNKIE